MVADIDNGFRLGSDTPLGKWDALIPLYAVAAAFCAPLTAEAVVAVLLTGALVLVLLARRVPKQQAACSPRSALPWLGLVVLFAGWELTAVLWGNDSSHPTFSLLLDPVLDTYPGRLVGWLAWLAVGRWLVTR